MIMKDIQERLEKEWPGSGVRLEKLAGDASDRSFYRAVLSAPVAGGIGTAVIMSMQPWTVPDELPYVNVQRHMLAAGLPVPEILFMDLGNGLIALEDFGDVTLEDAVRGKDREDVVSLYRKAVDLLLDIQIDGTRKMDRSCIAFSLAFDVDKLMFELNFFYENALGHYLKADIPPDEEKLIREGFLLIAGTLSSEPRVMTHRDYHSRNLMVKSSGEIGMVDFQDARMGPVQYDLASLLMDAYAALPDDIIDDIYEYYIKSNSSRIGTIVDKKVFDRIFYYMVVQRNIKACGSFAYLDVVKEKNRYLKYFAPAMRKVNEAMKLLPELEPLRGALSKYIEDLRDY